MTEVMDHENISQKKSVIDMKVNLPRKRILLLLFTILFAVAGIIAWTIPSPGYAGAVDYETNIPAGFVLSDAESTLAAEGYSVEADYEPEFRELPYLRITVESDQEEQTIITMSLNEPEDKLEFFAFRVISLRPYEVVQDLRELRIEHQEIAEQDLRDVLDAVNVPSSGTFTYVDEMDSLDFFAPTTLFFVLLFLHFPVTALLAILTIFLEFEQKPSFQHPEMPSMGSEN